MEIRWSKLPLDGKGKIPFGPVYFTRDYVRRGFLCKDKKYPQGRRGVVLGEHTFLGRVTHVDLRLPDGEFLRECPSITSGLSEERTPRLTSAPRGVVGIQST
jgi:hypothetical protein